MTKLSILEESVRPKPKRLIARVLAALDAGTAAVVHVARLVEHASATAIGRVLRNLASIGLAVQTGEVPLFFAAAPQVLKFRAACAKVPTMRDRVREALIADRRSIGTICFHVYCRREHAKAEIDAVKRELGCLRANGQALILGDAWVAHPSVLEARMEARAVTAIKYALNRPDYKIAPSELANIIEWAGFIGDPSVGTPCTRSRAAAWFVLARLARVEGQARTLPLSLLREDPVPPPLTTIAPPPIPPSEILVTGAIFYMLRTSGEGGLLWDGEIVQRLKDANFADRAIPLSPHALHASLLTRVNLLREQGGDVRVQLATWARSG